MDYIHFPITSIARDFQFNGSMSCQLCSQYRSLLTPPSSNTSLISVGQFNTPWTPISPPLNYLYRPKTYYASWHQQLESGASLVSQQQRICLPMQGKQVWLLIKEDPTCHRATKPMHHNYWALESGATTMEPTSHNYWSLCTPQPVLLNERTHRNEKPEHPN